MSEQCCPVCAGRGTVDPGFYRASAGQTVMLASLAREKCRRCEGLGTITVAGTLASPLHLIEEWPVGTGPFGF